VLVVRNRAEHGGGPLAGAAALLADTRAQLGLSEVIGVSALLGQAAAAGALGLDDRLLELLGLLAANPATGIDSLRVRQLTGATKQEADRLLEVLGPYGLEVAAERPRRPDELLDDLRLRSGVPRLLATMRRRFLGQSGLIKAVRLLTDLIRIVTDPTFGPPGVRASFAAEAEHLLGRPVLHELREWQAADELRTAPRTGGLGPLSRRDAARVLLGPTPAARLGLATGASATAVRARLAAEQHRWAVIAGRGQALEPAEAEAVDAVRRTLAGLFQDVTEGGDHAGAG
jgi:hypothetical protein